MTDQLQKLATDAALELWRCGMVRDDWNADDLQPIANPIVYHFRPLAEENKRLREMLGEAVKVMGEQVLNNDCACNYCKTYRRIRDALNSSAPPAGGGDGGDAAMERGEESGDLRST